MSGKKTHSLELEKKTSRVKIGEKTIEYRFRILYNTKYQHIAINLVGNRGSIYLPKTAIPTLKQVLDRAEKMSKPTDKKLKQLKNKNNTKSSDNTLAKKLANLSEQEKQILMKIIGD